MFRSSRPSVLHVIKQHLIETPDWNVLLAASIDSLFVIWAQVGALSQQWTSYLCVCESIVSCYIVSLFRVHGHHLDSRSYLQAPSRGEHYEVGENFLGRHPYWLKLCFKACTSHSVRYQLHTGVGAHHVQSSFSAGTCWLTRANGLPSSYAYWAVLVS